MSAATHRCPACGHEMAFEAHGTVDFSVLVFCPGCHTAMDRLDALGAFEAATRSDAPETFEEFVKRPDVLGVISAAAVQPPEEQR